MRHIILFFTLCWIHAWISNAAATGTKQVIVKSYYGRYQTEDKVPGLPAKSLDGPFMEVWISPVPKQSYHIGIVFPHLKDSYWQTAKFGLLQHAGALGVTVTLKDAGGYTWFGDQRAMLQAFAIEKMVDGVILASVDYLKMDSVIKSVTDSGLPVVGLINDIQAPDIKAKATVSYYDAGFRAAEFVLSHAAGKNIRIAFFPGPEDSGWADNMVTGFSKSLSEKKGNKPTAKIIETQYGDTRPEVQKMRLRFVLNNQANQNIDYIVGNAVAAAEAVDYLEKNRQRHPEARIVSTYMTPAVYDLIRDGKIEAAPYDRTLEICKISLDMMVRLLNGERPGTDFPFRAGPEYIMITRKNIAGHPYESLFGPRQHLPQNID